MTAVFNFTRLFASDIRRDGLIPAVLLGYPELAALEAERVRLAAALTEAEQGGGGYMDEASTRPQPAGPARGILDGLDDATSVAV